MKPLNKDKRQTRRTQQKSDDRQSHTTEVHLSVVSEKEREQYRIPTYGYILWDACKSCIQPI